MTSWARAEKLSITCLLISGFWQALIIISTFALNKFPSQSALLIFQAIFSNFLMNLLLWNSVDIWVPSYVFNDDSFLTWWNIPYFLFIFFSMVTCSWLSFYMTIVMWKVKKFHGNATYILSCMYISWFECLLGTLVILPYKYGIINLAGRF